MKRSEFLERVAVNCDGFTRSSVAAAAAVAEIAGVKWDPEEPRRPRRLKVHYDCCGQSFLTPDGTDASLVWSSAEMAAVYYDAVDAYNRLQSGELVPQDRLLQPALDAVVRERDHLNRLLKGEKDLTARLEERLAVDALQERDVALAELRETRLLLRDIATAVGLSWRPHETWAECSQLALDIRTAIVAHQRPADVISKTRRGRTVHYAIGPTRGTRDEAERDLREWFDKEAS